MFEKYTSERLLLKFPRPLINFIWYLWETNYDPNESELRVTLQDGGASGQQVIINSSGITVTQNFGCSLNADIAIRKIELRCFMEYY